MTEYSKSKNVLLFLIQHQQQFQLPNQSLDVAALVHNNKPLGASMSATHLVSKSSPPPSLKRSQTMPTNRQQQSPTVTGEGNKKKKKKLYNLVLMFYHRTTSCWKVEIYKADR